MRRPYLTDLPLVRLPQGYELRLICESDEAALAQLLSEAFSEMEWDVEHVQSRLTHAPDVKQTFVIRHEGQLVATASARLLPNQYPNSGYLHWVAAQNQHKGRQLGRSISLAVMHEFLALGCQDAVLETDDQRLPAIKTYLDLGFVAEHRHETHLQRWANVFDELNLSNGQNSSSAN